MFGNCEELLMSRCWELLSGHHAFLSSFSKERLTTAKWFSMHFKKTFGDGYAFLNHIVFNRLDALSVSSNNLRSYFWNVFDMQVHTHVAKEGDWWIFGGQPILSWSKA